MKIGVCLLFLSALCLRPIPVSARQWTDATGQHTLEASFVRAENSTVDLRKADGTVIDVPLEKLSEADRRYVKQQTAVPLTDTGSPTEKRRDPVAIAVLEVSSESYRERGYNGFAFGMSEDEVKTRLSGAGVAITSPATAKSKNRSDGSLWIKREDGEQIFHFNQDHRLIAIQRLFVTDLDKQVAALAMLFGKPADHDMNSAEATGRSSRSRTRGLTAAEAEAAANTASGLDVIAGQSAPPSVGVTSRRGAVLLRYSFPSAIVHVRARSYTEASDEDPDVSTEKSIVVGVIDREYALAQLSSDVVERRKAFEWVQKVAALASHDRSTLPQLPAYPGARPLRQKPPIGIQQSILCNANGRVFAKVTKHTLAHRDLPKGTVEMVLSLKELPGRSGRRSLLAMETQRANALLAREAFAPDESGMKSIKNEADLGYTYQWQTADGWKLSLIDDTLFCVRTGGDR